MLDNQNSLQKLGGPISLAMVGLAIWAIITQFNLTWSDIFLFCGAAYLGAMALVIAVFAIVIIKGFRKEP